MTRVRLRPRCGRCRPLFTTRDVLPGKVRHAACQGTGTTRFRRCSPCGGTGWVDCPICDGTGVAIEPRQIGWGRWSYRRRSEPGRPWWRF